MKIISVLLIALLLTGCSTIKKELMKVEGIAAEFQLEQGRIGSSGHTISGEVSITGALDNDGEYQLTSLDGRYTNAVTGRTIYIDGSRIK